MKKNINLRSLAAQAIEQVVEKGQSLSNVLPPLQQKVSDKDKALLQELCFGVLRTLSQLEWLISKLMARPMTGKQRTVHFLIMVGLYQLLYTRIPPHAALAETVEGAVAIKRPQLKGLINGVLRQFQRQQEALLAEFAEHENRYLHPKWLLKRLQQAWPEQWQEIVEANNQRPPMWLRVNRNHHSRDEWLALLNETGLEGFTHPDYPDAVRLATPAPVHALPGFAEGWVTVQDASAQGCMRYLQPENGERILDLCAAPGGKTTHILEVAPQAQVMAVDIDEQRLSRVYDNLKRLGVKAEVKQGDGRFPEQWCGNEQFDRYSAGCSLLRNRRYSPPSGYQMAAPGSGYRRVSPTAGRDPQCHLGAPEARRHAGLRNLFYSAGREQSANCRLPRANSGCRTSRNRHAGEPRAAKSAGRGRR